MSGAETIAFDAAVRLDAAAERPPLRFLTCGSVDDGKSTLLGRLLYEQNLILEDHLASLERKSGKYGTSGPEIDFSLLLDGLEAEREQRITIDVAYRYFATRRRAFVVPTPRATSNIPATWRLARPRPNWQCFWSMRARASRPDAASRHHRQSLGHSPRRRGGEQDRSGRLRPHRFRPDRGRLLRLCRATRLQGHQGHPDLRPLRR